MRSRISWVCLGVLLAASSLAAAAPRPIPQKVAQELSRLHPTLEKGEAWIDSDQLELTEDEQALCAFLAQVSCANIRQLVRFSEYERFRKKDTLGRLETLLTALKGKAKTARQADLPSPDYLQTLVFAYQRARRHGQPLLFARRYLADAEISKSLRVGEGLDREAAHRALIEAAVRKVTQRERQRILEWELATLLSRLDTSTTTWLGVESIAADLRKRVEQHDKLRKKAEKYLSDEKPSFADEEAAKRALVKIKTEYTLPLRAHEREAGSELDKIAAALRQQARFGPARTQGRAEQALEALWPFVEMGRRAERLYVLTDTPHRTELALGRTKSADRTLRLEAQLLPASTLPFVAGFGPRPIVPVKVSYGGQGLEVSRACTFKVRLLVPMGDQAGGEVRWRELDLGLMWDEASVTVDVAEVARDGERAATFELTQPRLGQGKLYCLPKPFSAGIRELGLEAIVRPSSPSVEVTALRSLRFRFQMVSAVLSSERSHPVAKSVELGPSTDLTALRQRLRDAGHALIRDQISQGDVRVRVRGLDERPIAVTSPRLLGFDPLRLDVQTELGVERLPASMQLVYEERRGFVPSRIDVDPAILQSSAELRLAQAHLKAPPSAAALRTASNDLGAAVQRFRRDQTQLAESVSTQLKSSVNELTPGALGEAGEAILARAVEAQLTSQVLRRGLERGEAAGAVLDRALRQGLAEAFATAEANRVSQALVSERTLERAADAGTAFLATELGGIAQRVSGELHGALKSQLKACETTPEALEAMKPALETAVARALRRNVESGWPDMVFEVNHAIHRTITEWVWAKKEADAWIKRSPEPRHREALGKLLSEEYTVVLSRVESERAKDLEDLASLSKLSASKAKLDKIRGNLLDANVLVEGYDALAQPARDTKDRLKRDAGELSAKRLEALLDGLAPDPRALLEEDEGLRSALREAMALPLEGRKLAAQVRRVRDQLRADLPGRLLSPPALEQGHKPHLRRLHSKVAALADLHAERLARHPKVAELVRAIQANAERLRKAKSKFEKAKGLGKELRARLERELGVVVRLGESLRLGPKGKLCFGAVVASKLAPNLDVSGLRWEGRVNLEEPRRKSPPALDAAIRKIQSVDGAVKKAKAALKERVDKLRDAGKALDPKRLEGKVRERIDAKLKRLAPEFGAERVKAELDASKEKLREVLNLTKRREVARKLNAEFQRVRDDLAAFDGRLNEARQSYRALLDERAPSEVARKAIQEALKNNDALSQAKGFGKALKGTQAESSAAVKAAQESLEKLGVKAEEKLQSAAERSMRDLMRELCQLPGSGKLSEGQLAQWKKLETDLAKAVDRAELEAAKARVALDMAEAKLQDVARKARGAADDARQKLEAQRAKLTEQVKGYEETWDDQRATLEKARSELTKHGSGQVAAVRKAGERYKRAFEQLDEKGRKKLKSVKNLVDTASTKVLSQLSDRAALELLRVQSSTVVQYLKASEDRLKGAIKAAKEQLEGNILAGTKLAADQEKRLRERVARTGEDFEDLKQAAEARALRDFLDPMQKAIESKTALLDKGVQETWGGALERHQGTLDDLNDSLKSAVPADLCKKLATLDDAALKKALKTALPELPDTTEPREALNELRRALLDHELAETLANCAVPKNVKLAIRHYEDKVQLTLQGFEDSFKVDLEETLGFDPEKLGKTLEANVKTALEGVEKRLEAEVDKRHADLEQLADPAKEFLSRMQRKAKSAEAKAKRLVSFERQISILGLPCTVTGELKDSRYALAASCQGQAPIPAFEVTGGIDFEGDPESIKKLKLDGEFPIKVHWDRLETKPDVGELLAQVLTNEVPGLEILSYSRTGKDVRFLARYQPDGFPMAIEVPVALDLSNGKLGVDGGAKAVLKKAILQAGDLLLERFTEDGLPGVGPAQVTKIELLDVPSGIGIALTCEIEVDGWSRLEIVVKLLPGRGLVFERPAEQILMALATSALDELLPAGVKLDLPEWYRLDGGFRLRLRVAIAIPVIEQRVETGISVGVGGIRFRGPIRLQLPGWYDVGYVSFGKLGLGVDLEKKTVSAYATFTISPGAANHYLIKVNGVGTIDLGRGIKNITLEVKGTLVLLTLFPLSESRTFVFPREGLVESTFTTSQTIKKILEAKGQLTVQALSDPFISLKADADVFGARIADVDVELNRDASGHIRAALKILESETKLAIQFDKYLTNPRAHWYAPLELCGLSVAVDLRLGKRVRCKASANLGDELSVTLDLPGLGQLTPWRVAEALLALLDFKLAPPSGFNVSLGDSTPNIEGPEGSQGAQEEGEEKAPRPPDPPKRPSPDDGSSPPWSWAARTWLEPYWVWVEDDGVLGTGAFKGKRRVQQWRQRFDYTHPSARAVLRRGAEDLYRSGVRYKVKGEHALSLDKGGKLLFHSQQSGAWKTVWDGRAPGGGYAVSPVSYFPSGKPVVVLAAEGKLVACAKGAALPKPPKHEARRIADLTGLQISTSPSPQRLDVLIRSDAFFARLAWHLGCLRLGGASFSTIQHKGAFVLIRTTDGAEYLATERGKGDLLLLRSHGIRVTDPLLSRELLLKGDYRRAATFPPVSGTIRGAVDGEKKAIPAALIFTSDKDASRDKGKSYLLTESELIEGTWSFVASEPTDRLRSFLAAAGQTTGRQAARELAWSRLLNGLEEATGGRLEVILGPTGNGGKARVGAFFVQEKDAKRVDTLICVDETVEKDGGPLRLRRPWPQIRNHWSNRTALLPRGVNLTPSSYLRTLVEGKWRDEQWGANPLGALR